MTLGLAGAGTDHPYTLGIPQTRVEEVLEEHAAELGADIRRGHELVAARPDGESVVVTVESGAGQQRIRAGYLAGCDGGRSTVRKQAGIDFPGTAATRFTLLGDVELADPDALDFGLHAGPGGSVFVIPRPGYVRILTDDPESPADQDTPVTLDLLESAVSGALGRPVEYVRGRVVLAGDAAHIHPPAGAIGVNVALDDAFNLGWKLAATVRGTAPAHLLGTYHAERHAAGAHVLASTRAQGMLGDPGQPLTDLLTRVAAHPAGNRVLAEIVTGLDTRYAMPGGGDHPWIGRLAPNLKVSTGAGVTDTATLLAGGRGLLLDLSGGQPATGWGGRLTVVSGTCPDHPDLRGLLLRPDGHTAWVDDGTGDLRAACEHWFGTP